MGEGLRTAIRVLARVEGKFVLLLHHSTRIPYHLVIALTSEASVVNRTADVLPVPAEGMSALHGMTAEDRIEAVRRALLADASQTAQRVGGSTTPAGGQSMQKQAPTPYGAAPPLPGVHVAATYGGGGGGGASSNKKQKTKASRSAPATKATYSKGSAAKIQVQQRSEISDAELVQRALSLGNPLLRSYDPNKILRHVAANKSAIALLQRQLAVLGVSHLPMARYAPTYLNLAFGSQTLRDELLWDAAEPPGTCRNFAKTLVQDVPGEEPKRIIARRAHATLMSSRPPSLPPLASRGAPPPLASPPSFFLFSYIFFIQIFLFFFICPLQPSRRCRGW